MVGRGMLAKERHRGGEGRGAMGADSRDTA